ncbi:hypothetical protein DFP72DRAFT_847737 [Ephemerocybe angulata]|uniref:Uncharacterized protein n=1 Tax=Ephemerocybe angulata TaxID=980116 RepID=A0A8H6HY75_9AGAR|nr:hypothetical protein DFP72DRAFT_847737 [Tulosesus angulatus]
MSTSKKQPSAQVNMSPDPRVSVREAATALNSALIEASTTWKAPSEPGQAHPYLVEKLLFLRALTDKLLNELGQLTRGSGDSYQSMGITGRVMAWMQELAKPATTLKDPGAALDLGMFKRQPYPPSSVKLASPPETAPGPNSGRSLKGKEKEVLPAEGSSEGEDGGDSEDEEGGESEDEDGSESDSQAEDEFRPAKDDDPEEESEEDSEEEDEGDDNMVVDAGASTKRKRSLVVPAPVPKRLKLEAQPTPAVSFPNPTSSIPGWIPPNEVNREYSELEGVGYVFAEKCRKCLERQYDYCYVNLGDRPLEPHPNPGSACATCKRQKGKCEKTLTPRPRGPSVAITVGGSRGQQGEDDQKPAKKARKSQAGPVREPSWDDLHSPGGTLTLYTPCGKFKLSDEAMAAAGAISHQSTSAGKEKEGGKSDGKEKERRRVRREGKGAEKSGGKEKEGSKSDGKEKGGSKSDGKEKDGRKSDGREKEGGTSDRKDKKSSGKDSPQKGPVGTVSVGTYSVDPSAATASMRAPRTPKPTRKVDPLHSGDVSGGSGLEDRVKGLSEHRQRMDGELADVKGMFEAVKLAAAGIMPLTDRVTALEAGMEERQGEEGSAGQELKKKVRDLEVRIDNYSTIAGSDTQRLGDRVKALEDLIVEGSTDKGSDDDQEGGVKEEVKALAKSVEELSSRVGVIEKIGGRVEALETKVKEIPTRAAARVKELEDKIARQEAQLQEAQATWARQVDLFKGEMVGRIRAVDLEADARHKALSETLAQQSTTQAAIMERMAIPNLVPATWTPTASVRESGAEGTGNPEELRLTRDEAEESGGNTEMDFGGGLAVSRPTTPSDGRSPEWFRVVPTAGAVEEVESPSSKEAPASGTSSSARRMELPALEVTNPGGSTHVQDPSSPLTPAPEDPVRETEKSPPGKAAEKKKQGGKKKQGSAVPSRVPPGRASKAGGPGPNTAVNPS